MPQQHRIRRLVSSLAGLTLIACAPLTQTMPSGTPSPTINARTEHTLQPGTRIRATIGSAKRYGVVGRVLEVRGDSVVLQPDAPEKPYAVLKSRFTEIQISQATSTQDALGLLIGGLAGGSLGYAFGYATAADTQYESNANEFYNFSSTRTRQQNATRGAWVGGVLGALAGWAAGSSIHRDQWTTVPLESLIRITPSGHHGGWDIGLSLRK
jgi:hypothetical protein